MIVNSARGQKNGPNLFGAEVLLSCFFVGADGNLALKHFLERDQGLAAAKTHLQELVVDNVEQVVVVLSIELDKQVILASGVVTLDYLRYSFQTGR